MSQQQKRKFKIRIPLRKLKQSPKSTPSDVDTDNNHSNHNNAEQTTSMETAEQAVLECTSTNSTSPQTACTDSNSNSNSDSDNNLDLELEPDEDEEDESDDMHDIDMGDPQHVQGGLPPLADNDMFTDEEDHVDDAQTTLKAKSMLARDAVSKIHVHHTKNAQTSNTGKPDSDDNANDVDKAAEREREKEMKAKAVDHEYEMMMKESMQSEPANRGDGEMRHSLLSSNERIKLERQKEVESVSSNDEHSWIHNEKHAISMRHISIRDDKKKMLSLFMKQAVENQQFNFIKVNLRSYLTLNEHAFDAHVFHSIDESLQLNQLFNVNMDSETMRDIADIIHKLETFVMEKHFEIEYTEKRVKFALEHYQRDCNAIKNKLESCPILYVLLLHGDIDFDVLLSSDMTIIAFICLNALIRKKVQRKFETLVKREHAKSVEALLFEHYKKNRTQFLEQHAKKQESAKHTNTKQEADDDDEHEHHEDNGDEKKGDKKEQTELIAGNEHKILHDKYPLFCQKYLRFLMSFPDYRNAIISGDITMHKIFAFDQQQLSQPPPLHTTDSNHNNSSNGSEHGNGNNYTQSEQNKKRKRFGGGSPISLKRRKLSVSEINSNMNSKERIIWEGLLINDAIKCHIRMRQIGGKSIWTLPFKHFRPSMDTHSDHHHAVVAATKHELSIGGRINIVSIIKFIKQLRKHKTRRILFAEVESNEHVNHNSYHTLSSQLRVGGRAGVIDFEKQCGILIYIISSSFLDPAHAMSHQLGKYFDGHKAKFPKTSIFAIVIISMEVYNQVRRKVSKSSKPHSKPSKPAKPCKPAQPPTPNSNHSSTQNQQQTNTPGPPQQPPKPPHSGPAPPRPRLPPQPPKPPTSANFSDSGSSMQSVEKQEEQQQEVEDVWNQIGNEIEDDLGELPPPLPPHLLAERERYKQQNQAQQQQPQYQLQPSRPPPPPRPPTLQNDASCSNVNHFVMGYSPQMMPPTHMQPALPPRPPPPHHVMAVAYNGMPPPPPRPPLPPPGGPLPGHMYVPSNVYPQPRYG